MFSVIVTSCVSSDTQAYHSTMEEELQAHSQEVMALRAVVGSYKVQEAQHKRSEPGSANQRALFSIQTGNASHN